MFQENGYSPNERKPNSTSTKHIKKKKKDFLNPCQQRHQTKVQMSNLRKKITHHCTSNTNAQGAGGEEGWEFSLSEHSPSTSTLHPGTTQI